MRPVRTSLTRQRVALFDRTGRTVRIMAKHPDVLVVGGGVIGLTSAYLLARSGLSVEVVDKGEMGREASWAGAGILPPWGDGEYATPLDQLRAYSVSRFAAFSAEMRERTGIDNEYHVCGGIEFIDPEDFDQPALWRREGVLHERVAHPAAPPGADVYFLPYAQVRNPRHMRALTEACTRSGVRLIPNRPYTGRRDSDGRTVVIATGAWSDDLAGPFGVRPVHGEILLFAPDRDDPVRPDRTLLLHGKRYLVPRKDGRVLVGSTEQPEFGFTKRSTPEAFAELRAFALSVRPALGARSVEAAWSGMRPGTPDGLPFIGRVPGRPNVLVAAGHFRAGIQTSIGTAECVRALVLGEPPPVPLEAFAPGRQPHPPMRTAFRS
jgi:glycine oxidase